MDLQKWAFTNFATAASFAVVGFALAFEATMELARHRRNFVDGFFGDYAGAKGTIWFVELGLLWISVGALFLVLQPDRTDKAVILHGRQRVEELSVMMSRALILFDLLLIMPILDIWINAGK